MLNKAVFVASFILLAIAGVLFYVYLAGISNFFIVRFDSLRGMTFLGGKTDVLGILLTGFAIYLMNAILAGRLAKRDSFLAHLTSFSTLFFSLLILIVIGVIITTN